MGWVKHKKNLTFFAATIYSDNNDSTKVPTQMPPPSSSSVNQRFYFKQTQIKYGSKDTIWIHLPGVPTSLHHILILKYFFLTQYSLPPSTFGVNNRRELPVLYYRIYYTGKLYKIDEVRKLGETMD